LFTAATICWRGTETRGKEDETKDTDNKNEDDTPNNQENQQHISDAGSEKGEENPGDDADEEAKESAENNDSGDRREEEADEGEKEEPAESEEDPSQTVPDDEKASEDEKPTDKEPAKDEAAAKEDSGDNDLKKAEEAAKDKKRKPRKEMADGKDCEEPYESAPEQRKDRRPKKARSKGEEEGENVPYSASEHVRIVDMRKLILHELQKTRRYQQQLDRAGAPVSGTTDRQLTRVVADDFNEKAQRGYRINSGQVRSADEMR